MEQITQQISTKTKHLNQLKSYSEYISNELKSIEQKRKNDIQAVKNYCDKTVSLVEKMYLDQTIRLTKMKTDLLNQLESVQKEYNRLHRLRRNPTSASLLREPSVDNDASETSPNNEYSSNIKNSIDIEKSCSIENSCSIPDSPLNLIFPKFLSMSHSIDEKSLSFSLYFCSWEIQILQFDEQGTNEIVVTLVKGPKSTVQFDFCVEIFGYDSTLKIEKSASLKNGCVMRSILPSSSNISVQKVTIKLRPSSYRDLCEIQSAFIDSITENK